jgi:hypothetical protein
MDLLVNVPIEDIVCWIYFVLLAILGVETIKLVFDIYKHFISSD